MGEFRTFDRAIRVPAAPMQKIVDPAGWSSKALADVDSWSYRITDSDVHDLSAAIQRLRTRKIPTAEISRENFDLGRFGATMDDIRQELVDGRGIVMLRNFPVDSFDREAIAIAYLGLGTYLGTLVSQNKQGHLLGHIKDLGSDYRVSRGYSTNAELLFHSDGCDLIGLLCLQTSKSGGTSLVASSVTIYNRMLELRPDLVEVLTQDFYKWRGEEINPGEKAWYKQPIFTFEEGYFSAQGAGASLDKAQRLPDVPPWTAKQKEAIEFYRQTTEECAVQIDFQRGDIQFLNGWVMLHARRAFEDWPDPAKKRHLLRLWLNDPAVRPVPKEQRGRRSGQGVRLAGVDLVVPLEVEASPVWGTIAGGG